MFENSAMNIVKQLVASCRRKLPLHTASKTNIADIPSAIRGMLNRDLFQARTGAIRRSLPFQSASIIIRRFVFYSLENGILSVDWYVLLFDCVFATEHLLNTLSRFVTVLFC